MHCTVGSDFYDMTTNAVIGREKSRRVSTKS